MLKALTLLAAGEMGGAVKRRINAAVFYAAAGVFGLIALVFGLKALHVWLTGIYASDIIASLIVAGGLLAVALVLAFVGTMQKNRTAPSSLGSVAAVAAPIMATAAAKRMNLGVVALIGAIVGGAVLGRRIAK